jgi:hypothetical protein
MILIEHNGTSNTHPEVVFKECHLHSKSFIGTCNKVREENIVTETETIPLLSPIIEPTFTPIMRHLYKWIVVFTVLNCYGSLALAVG